MLSALEQAPALNESRRTMRSSDCETLSDHRRWLRGWVTFTTILALFSALLVMPASAGAVTNVANLSVTPTSMHAVRAVNQTWTVTATDTNGLPAVGAQIDVFVTGANSMQTEVLGYTDANGQITFSYAGAAIGTDTITFFNDANSNGVLDPDEHLVTATVVWAIPTDITLSPTILTRMIDHPLTLTATVTDAFGNDLVGSSVSYVISGPNSTSGTLVTGLDGTVSFIDSGNQSGTDTITATAQDLATSATATIQWIQGGGLLLLSQSPSSPTVGSTVTVTGTLKQSNGDPIAGVPVNFNVTGANYHKSTVTTDSNGVFSYEYTGSAAGSDKVVAYADFDRSGTQQAADPANTIYVNWVQGTSTAIALTPQSQSAEVGSTASLDVALTGSGISNVTVRYSVKGANSGSGSVQTSSNGIAKISYAGSNIGTDTVTAYADLNNNGNPDSGEPSTSATITWTAASPTATFQPAQPAAPKTGCLYFSQTQHNVCAGFLAYWNKFGSVQTFGYPLTEEFQENGLTVQYFERARFEWHPGAWPSHFDVELGLLGNEVTVSRMSETPFQTTTPSTAAGCTYFAATGHNLCGAFADFWTQNGQLAVFGYPISEAFQEKNADTGETYTVQYFQRARFELHPGSTPGTYRVELGRLGAQVLQMRYGVSDY